MIQDAFKDTPRSGKISWTVSSATKLRTQLDELLNKRQFGDFYIYDDLTRERIQLRSAFDAKQEEHRLAHSQMQRNKAELDRLKRRVLDSDSKIAESIDSLTKLQGIDAQLSRSGIPTKMVSQLLKTLKDSVRYSDRQIVSSISASTKLFSDLGIVERSLEVKQQILEVLNRKPNASSLKAINRSILTTKKSATKALADTRQKLKALIQARQDNLLRNKSYKRFYDLLRATKTLQARVQELQKQTFDLDEKLKRNLELLHLNDWKRKRITPEELPGLENKVELLDTALMAIEYPRLMGSLSNKLSEENIKALFKAHDHDDVLFLKGVRQQTKTPSTSLEN